MTEGKIRRLKRKERSQVGRLEKNEKIIESKKKNAIENVKRQIHYVKSKFRMDGNHASCRLRRQAYHLIQWDHIHCYLSPQ